MQMQPMQVSGSDRRVQESLIFAAANWVWVSMGGALLRFQSHGGCVPRCETDTVGSHAERGACRPSGRQVDPDPIARSRVAGGARACDVW